MHDFRTMSEKDVFQARLKNEVIDFGHIPVWRFGRFVKFCIKHGLLYQPPTYMNYAYLVKHKFYYARTFSKVSHLPLGNIFIWLCDLFHPRRGKVYSNYTWREGFTVEPRGTRPGFTYVIATHQGISL